MGDLGMSNTNEHPELPEKEKLLHITKKISRCCWKNDLSIQDIEGWLDNFDGSALGDGLYEHKLALLLLMNFVYFRQSEVKHLCRKVFLALIHELIPDDGIDDINLLIEEIVNSTFFVPLGSPSESSSTILYYYRLENSIPPNKFGYINKDSILKNTNIKNIVFIDDVSLSGTQATRAIRKIDGWDDIYAKKNIYFTPLITSKKAIDNFKERLENINIIPAIVVNEGDKCLSDYSYIFRDNIHIENCKVMVDYYHEKYSMEYEPLGYKCCNLAIGFFYNVPNNTLPLFWTNNEKYQGLFTRTEKIYTKTYSGDNEHEYFY